MTDSKNNTAVTTYATYEAYLAAQKAYGFHPLSCEEWEKLWNPENDPVRKTLAGK